MSSQTSNVGPRAVAAASIGNALEWYDFSVYAFFATYIAHNFFASGDESAALLNTFMLFGAGFIARPLGAVVTGAIGDRRGRKSALMLSIMTMGLGVLIIVVTPGYAFIGLGAPLLLLVARLLQGFSAGGEIGGAASFLVEHAPPGKAGFYAAWLQASMAIANLLSSVIGLTITTFFSEEQMYSWAWRIPFVFGLLIIPVGVYIRRELPETEVFEKTKEAQEQSGERTSWLTPLKSLIVHHPRGMLAAFALSVLWTTAIYGFVIYATTYYTSEPIGLGFTQQDAFLASVVGNIMLLLGCLYFGRLSDRVGRRKILFWGALSLLVVPWFLMTWLHAGPTLPKLIVVHIILCILVASIASIAPMVISQIFPPSIRSSGIAISYNIAAIFFAGFTPAIMAWATVEVSVLAPVYWVAIGAAVCLIFLPMINSEVRHAHEEEVIEREALDQGAAPAAPTTTTTIQGTDDEGR